MAEWLCSGLQSRLCRFDSDPSLHVSSLTRRLRIAVGGLLGLIVLALLIVGINHPWFDEALAPELVALRDSKPAPLEDNAFPFALGFMAPADHDPRAAGIEIVRVLQARRDRGEPATISKEEKDAIRGEPLTLDGLGTQSRPIAEPSAATTSFGQICLPRYELDCAHRLIAQAALLDPGEPPLSVLLPRYETLLQQVHYVETPAPDPMTPWPPLDP